MPANPYQDELQRTLGGSPGTSNTMPVGSPWAALQPVKGRTSDQPVPVKGPTSDQPLVRQRAPAGFDQKNWDDPTMKSVKYDAGRMLYGKTRPSEIAAIVNSADFQKRFKGATFDGKDRINFQGALSDGASGVPVYDIDVLQSADRGADTSNGLWWGHDVPGMNQGPGGATSNTTPVSNGAPAMLGQQSDLMAQLLAALQAQTGIDDPQTRLLAQFR